jgi:hypothetical protein
MDTGAVCEPYSLDSVCTAAEVGVEDNAAKPESVQLMVGAFEFLRAATHELHQAACPKAKAKA